MLTKSDFKGMIAQNLADPRLYAIQSFLVRLIERRTFGDGIEQYRITDKKTNAPVTSLDDFIAKLDADSLFADYFYYSDKMQGDRTHPTAVNLSNFVVNLDEHSQEDSLYYGMFGRDTKHNDDKNILILMNYLSDGDLDLPLKIYEIRLIAPK